MSNKFGIPRQVVTELRARDKTCVYCHKVMRTFAKIRAGLGSRADQATIEHLNCDPPFYWKDGLTKEGLAICCSACNSSRGKKKLADWLKTDYCVSRNISENMVAEPVRRYLSSNPNKPG